MRPPLDAAAVRDAVLRPGGLWTSVTVVDETGSTNADLLTGAGAVEGAVLVAESQTAGRGRLGRSWVSPPRAALTFSVLLRPEAAASRLGWLPLLAGVAVATAVRSATGTQAQLKWPNDVLVGDRKLGGILAERAPEGDVVVGIGVNVSTIETELPPPGPGSLPATSLALEGAPSVARDALLIETLSALDRLYAAFRLQAPPVKEYRQLCATLGRNVRVELPGTGILTGLAEDVDDDGRLLVRDHDGELVAVAAGDVVHLR